LWLDNKISGIVGELTAKWIKKYLIQIRGEKCEFCGWNERNKYTNRVPVEIEHVDGKYKNNRIENLKLICPNCHSLTPTYRGLNRGKGRSLRRRRYIKNIK
jgi:predicted HNH restriction endonuclease